MNNANSQKSTLYLSFKDEEIALHRFGNEDSLFPPILLIHGSIENGRVFYSRSGKGLAPYLHKQGFDVFVADLRGRGESRPKVSRRSKASQTDTVSEEIPAIITKIKEITGSDSIHLGAHSWGGVLLLSMYALYHDKIEINCMILLGSKRRISIFNWNRFLIVDLGWSILGRILLLLYGYFPAVKVKAGSDNDPGKFYFQNNRWVYSKTWIDPETGFDYSKKLQSINLPLTYFYAGIDDRLLGHPIDVKIMAQESGVPDNVIILSKENGNLRDYGHIDMLTHPDAEADHFPEIAKLFKKHSA